MDSFSARKRFELKLALQVQRVLDIGNIDCGVERGDLANGHPAAPQGGERLGLDAGAVDVGRSRELPRVCWDARHGGSRSSQALEPRGRPLLLE